MCRLLSHNFCFLLQIFPQLKVVCFVAGEEDLLCKKLSFPAVIEFMSTKGKSRHSYHTVQSAVQNALEGTRGNVENVSAPKYKVTF